MTLIPLCLRILFTGKFLIGMLDLHGKHCKHNSISTGISCGISYGHHDFQVACVQMASSCSESLIMWAKYQFTFLSLVSFKKSKHNLGCYLCLYLPFGRKIFLKFICLSSNLNSLLIFESQFSCVKK